MLQLIFLQLTFLRLRLQLQLQTISMVNRALFPIPIFIVYTPFSFVHCLCELNETSAVKNGMVVGVISVGVFGFQHFLLAPFEFAHQVVLLPFVDVVMFEGRLLLFGLMREVVVSFDVFKFAVFYHCTSILIFRMVMVVIPF